jgi:rhodanese-related sulfurtransferase
MTAMEVTAEQANQLVEEEGALLLDVREDDEWQAGHAPEATHIPLGEVMDLLTRLPRDRPIVAVCRMGGRSERATIALRNEGLEVVNLVGGMQAWAAAGLPVVTDSGDDGTVI